MRMLVSVRDGSEALRAAEAGADFIDLKEPRAGALGGLEPSQIRDIVAVLRRHQPRVTISATVGDLPIDAADAILRQVDAVGQCGVDLVKVGVPGQGGAAACDLLRRLGATNWQVVPVLLADAGVAANLLATACAQPFPALMLDTQGKTAGSLFDFMPVKDVAEVIRQARTAGKLIGLAGALRDVDVPKLHALQPEFAGFRSAVCDGARTGELVGDKVRALRRALMQPIVEGGRLGVHLGTPA
ncbi:(5-formylfuran-3-yl)methyl phosphate synthase [Thauera sp. 2A1]|uniref:(5-formylfuran-3-yl)methyl phosphate synthase n=1 Tax=Thauera sp. 2A1 TaxID=2570191 RepID=UPI00129162F1|nr:(5-formylfuran-3-yl)methyl phosphate synthase [Thauera sp. 2A1]KAI5916949.1 (5-formylfuran-3-yl)methyl phosphate synthase [Thauera sp. 2A1]